jgi:hypothetical protein
MTDKICKIITAPETDMRNKERPHLNPPLRGEEDIIWRREYKERGRNYLRAFRKYLMILDSGSLAQTVIKDTSFINFLQWYTVI